MKNFTQKFIGLFALVCVMSFTVDAQEIGDVYQGGYLFYIDDTGQNGLIASSEDLEGSYEWGCFEIDVSGSDGVSIGTGFQNTLDIINNACSTEIGGFNAAQVAFEYESGGYTDWHLPSKDELIKMYNTIGNGGDQGNLGEFNTTPGYWYWSSSENNNNSSFGMSFSDGYSSNAPKSNFYVVRVIRSVTFETETSYEINDSCSSNSIIDYLSDHELANKPISYQLNQGWNMVGYYGSGSNNEMSVQINEETLSNGSTLEETFQIIKNVLGQFWSSEYSSLNTFTPGEGYMMYVISNNPPAISFSAQFEMPQISGCMDCESLNYNPLATVSDESCLNSPNPCASINDYLIDYEVDNRPISYQLNQGWNMVGYYGSGSNNEMSVQINEETLSNGSTLEETFQIIKNVLGQFWSSEYSSLNTFTPGEGYMMYVISNNPPAISFSAQFEIPQISGCMDCQALNYSPLSTMNSLACIYSVGDQAQGGIIFYVDETGTRGLVASSEDLEDVYEWGCYGQEVNGADGIVFGTGFQNTLNVVSQNCQTTTGTITAAQVALEYELEGYSDWFLPSKDEMSLLYQNLNLLNIEISLDDFYWTSTKDTVYYVYDYNAFRLKHDVIFGISTQSSWRTNSSRVLPIRAFGYTFGCMDSLACNYNPVANMTDGSCEYAEQGYDCEGNIVLQYQVGDFAEGGIIFQINEDGTGLVSALEDLTEGAADPNVLGFNGYEWGCYQQEVNGADGTSIGTGYQNTMDIVNQGCSTQNGGITAAQAALDTEINGYSDWYLPSKGELLEMYNTIGNGGPEGNIGNFITTGPGGLLWSSSEYNNSYAWYVDFGNGFAYNANFNYKDYTYRVRVIRAF